MTTSARTVQDLRRQVRRVDNVEVLGEPFALPALPRQGEIEWEWSEERRERLEERLNIRAFYSCGVSPVVGHGLTGECAARCGLHVQEDHFVVECIDPETLEPVKDGEPGEVVVTALTIEASPIIRYRSGEIARLFHDKCECGRTTLRMSWARSHAAGGEL